MRVAMAVTELQQFVKTALRTMNPLDLLELARFVQLEHTQLKGTILANLVMLHVLLVLALQLTA